MKTCINRRCNKQLDDAFTFCPFCGKSQLDQPKKHRRANGTGSIYHRKDIKKKPWAAYATINTERVNLGNYATKKEAEEAVAAYLQAPTKYYGITLEDLHDSWLKSKAYTKLNASTQSGYTSAWTKLTPLYKSKFKDLRTYDFQRIIDYYEGVHHELGKGGKPKYIGHRGRVTMEPTSTPKMRDGLGYSALNNIKCLASHLYQFAMRDDIVHKNYAQFLELPEKTETDALAFTDVQVELLRQNIYTVPYCDYIYALCYLNFRVSEFLELTADCYHKEKIETGKTVHYFIAGKKTAAGKGRCVPIHPNVLPIVKRCLAKCGETIFCRDNGKAMDKDHFLKYCFYPAMDALKLGRAYTTHSCRRTFSTRMSAAGARCENIATLMGHASFDIDKKYYLKQELKTLYDEIIKMA